MQMPAIWHSCLDENLRRSNEEKRSRWSVVSDLWLQCCGSTLSFLRLTLTIALTLTLILPLILTLTPGRKLGGLVDLLTVH